MSIHKDQIKHAQKEFVEILKPKIQVNAMIHCYELACLNVKNICLEIYELETSHFLSAPEIAWQAAIKQVKIKLDLVTDTGILLMVEKVLEVQFVMLFLGMLELITNT